MGISRAIGRFVESALLGGSLEDVAFELRVLKQEVGRLQQRMERDLEEIRDRLDRLEGKPGKGKGRGRLSILGGAELADAAAERPADPKVEAAPASTAPTPPVRPPADPPGRREAAPDPAFSAGMTIAEAHARHPDARAVFALHHLPGCPSCAVSRFETVGDGARDHGLDVEALIADLNRLAEA